MSFVLEGPNGIFDEQRCCTHHFCFSLSVKGSTSGSRDCKIFTLQKPEFCSSSLVSAQLAVYRKRENLLKGSLLELDFMQ